MCKNEKRTHGTAATGVSVAEMLASEARRDRRACTSTSHTETPLYAFSRAIDRESLAGVGNSLKQGLMKPLICGSGFVAGNTDQQLPKQ